MTRRSPGLLAVLAATALGVATAGRAADAPPAKKPLTLEALHADRPIVSRSASGFAWRDASRVTWLATEGTGPGAAATLWQYDVRDGTRTALITKPNLPGTAKPFPLSGYRWNGAGTAILLAADSDLWLWRFDAKSGEALVRLTNDKEAEEQPLFSPDGTKVAFSKGHDLWVVDVATKAATRLTATGTDTLRNGTLDWVYEEELSNRRGRAFAWSPDSRSIAYLRLDGGRVPEYPIVDFLPPNGALTRQRYPNAGDPNAIPSIRVVSLDGRETAGYAPVPDDVLISPEISWTADSAAVSFVTLDRDQTRRDLFLLPRSGGEPRRLLSETDPAWINAIDAPRFLKDGSGFLLLSETTGFLHLSRHALDGTKKNAVTSGAWMIDGPWDVDEKGGAVWFVATEKDPRERHVYRARLDGTGLTRVTKEEGTHGLILAPDGRHFVSAFSSVTAPPRTTLRKANGSVAAVLDEPANTLGDYALPAVELGSFRGADGTLFYTSLLKPPDFDPSRRYPVLVYVYGGPHAQMVRNGFTPPGSLALLASKGVLVWTMDGRGSWGRGHAFETPILKNLGARELADQLEGIAELKKRPYVDPERIGITGWSYGGYMTLFAATHAGETFRSAVAGAPVTDWKFYDSIYTERYMKLPKENAEGYKTSSPVQAAGKLGTKLLILHGTSDDNVHMQNTMVFADELMKAKKDFDFVPLPRQPHGPRDPEARYYRDQRLVEFFERTLLK